MTAAAWKCGQDMHGGGRPGVFGCGCARKGNAQGGAAHVVVGLEDVIVDESSERGRGDVSKHVDGDGLQAECQWLQVCRGLQEDDPRDRRLHSIHSTSRWACTTFLGLVNPKRQRLW